MLDFNAKKEILRRLQKKGAKNVFMRVICAVAALFVKIWYGIACWVSMVLSDKHGNFLGIKGLGEKKKSRREDDIVYVKKPFLGRVLSAVLAVSFIAMFIPELGFDITVSAAGEYVEWQGTGYYYNTSEWDEKEIKISRVNEIAGNGSAKIFWQLIDGSPDVYEVYYENRSNGVEETASLNWKLTNYTFQNLSNGTQYTFRVRARKNVKLYVFLEADPEAGRPQDRYEPANITEAVYSDWIEFVLDRNLDAAMDLPVLQPIEYDTVSNKATLKWTHVAQVGYDIDGMDNARPAEGYVIFRATINSANSSVTSYQQIAARRTSVLKQESGTNEAGYPVTYLYFDDNTVVQGMVYEYYVMAYRDVYGMSNGEYAPSSPGMITSAGADGAVKQQLVTKPTSPQNVKVTSNGKNTLTVTWQAGSGNVDGYYVYRSDKELDVDMARDAGYSDFAEYVMATKVSGTVQLDELASNIKSYADSSPELVNDTTYWYYVIAYVNKNNTTRERMYSLPESASGRIGAKVDSPTGLKTVSNDGYIDVSWNSVKNADGYLLHIIKIRNSDGTMIPEEERQEIVIDWPQNKYTHEDFDGYDLLNEEMYTYYVEAYINVTTNGDESASNRDKLISTPSGSKTATVGIVIGAPEDVSAVGRDGSIDVSWSKVNGATGYELHYWKAGEADNEKIIDRSGLNYNHPNLKYGDVYYYYVLPYKVVNGARVHGEPSKTVSAQVGVPIGIPQDLIAVTTDGQVTVSWSKVNGAEGYILEYKQPGQSWDFDINTGRGSNGRSIDLSKETYNHTRLLNGQVFEYRVRAYKTVSGERVYSETSVIVSVTVGITLDAPRDLVITTTDSAATLKWTASSGAQGYVVHAISGNSHEEFDVSKPQYVHTGLVSGQVWTYYVVAYKTVNGERVYSPESAAITVTIGSQLDPPKDFTVTTTDGNANLKWTASNGAQGYIVYARSGGQTYQYDVSKTQFTHTGLINGDTWTYYVVAYKTVNGTKIYSNPTQNITVRIGVSMAAAVDLIATAGNRQIVLTWSAVAGAQGYVVYLYNDITMEYEPIAVTSKTTYTHLGLKNGIGYTYMVAAYKDINGTRVYGEYSMPVTAIPTSGSTTDIDRELTIKGTAPYGISHGEYISAGANHGAFDESVDVYFTTNADATNAVRDVLKGYAGGLNSFIIYPFDISIYRENTLIEVEPNRGYSVTITMPIPDRLIAYRDYITVIHINEDADDEYITDIEWLEYTDRRLEVLPCAVVDIDNIWCLQFECTSFSPYAIVIYKEHLSDVSAGGGVMDGIFAGNFNSGVLLFTALPDILPNNKKLRVVYGGKKRYRIKSIEKRDI